MAKKNGFKTFAEREKVKTKFRQEKIQIEQWGMNLIVSQMTARERDTWLASIGENFDKPLLWTTEQKVALLAVTVKDEGGGRPRPEWMAEEPVEIIDNLTKKSLNLNGMGEAAQQALEKN